MVLSQKEIDDIVKFVKKEPRTIQDISRLIKRAWVTTDSYVQQIKESTGLINIKTFRKGTQGALKLVYYNYAEILATDDIRGDLYNHIKTARKKTDFDFFEIFQFVEDKKKKVFYEEYKDENISEKQHLASLFRQAKRTVYIFSGNLSFINMIEGKVRMIDVIEEIVKRKVLIKILCRVNIASLNNIDKLSHLLQKYPEFIDIRHCYHPLRGFIIDESIARFKAQEALKDYKSGELPKNMRIFYEIFDDDWIVWLQKVFWSLSRISINYSERVNQFKRFF